MPKSKIQLFKTYTALLPHTGSTRLPQVPKLLQVCFQRQSPFFSTPRLHAYWPEQAGRLLAHI